MASMDLSRLDVLSLSTDHCLHRLLPETGPEVQMRTRDRDPLLFVWYTLSLSTTVLYESARCYAALARITLLLSVVLVAEDGLPEVSLSMFLTACKNEAYFPPKQLDEKLDDRAGSGSEVVTQRHILWIPAGRRSSCQTLPSDDHFSF